MGYQHYHLAQLLLTIFDPRLCKAGFEILLKRREADVSAAPRHHPLGQAFPRRKTIWKNPLTLHPNMTSKRPCTISACWLASRLATRQWSIPCSQPRIPCKHVSLHKESPKKPPARINWIVGNPWQIARRRRLSGRPAGARRIGSFLAEPGKHHRLVHPFCHPGLDEAVGAPPFAWSTRWMKSVAPADTKTSHRRNGRTPKHFWENSGC